MKKKRKKLCYIQTSTARMAESAQAEEHPQEDIDAALRSGLAEGCLCGRVTARGWASFLAETLQMFRNSQDLMSTFDVLARVTTIQNLVTHSMLKPRQMYCRYTNADT